MIIKKETKDNIAIYTVSKDFPDTALEGKLGKFCTMRNVKAIIDHNADVYTDDGKLLLRFRKGVLQQKNIDIFFDNVIAFAKQKTSTRGIASGSNGEKGPTTNIPIMSNILGYYDKWSIGHKHIFKMLGIPQPFKVRVASFTSTFPDKWEASLPLIQEIDRMYKKLNPTNHRKQLAAANETAYHVKDTAFTTITTNVNLQTAFHTDSGDFEEGFGNLVVIEKGTPYTGGYTCFPQYGVGVDVRMGDFLAMDVHQLHGNIKMKPGGKDSVRMSIVCYLREDVYKNSKGTKPSHVARNIKTMARIKEQFKALKEKEADEELD